MSLQNRNKMGVWSSPRKLHTQLNLSSPEFSPLFLLLLFLGFSVVSTHPAKSIVLCWGPPSPLTKPLGWLGSDLHPRLGDRGLPGAVFAGRDVRFSDLGAKGKMWFPVGCPLNGPGKGTLKKTELLGVSSKPTPRDQSKPPTWSPVAGELSICPASELLNFDDGHLVFPSHTVS